MPMVIDLRTVPARRAEKMVFDSTYKGVTDIVTGKLWPLPAFHVTRLLARLGIGPNARDFRRHIAHLHRRLAASRSPIGAGDWPLPG